MRGRHGRRRGRRVRPVLHERHDELVARQAEERGVAAHRLEDGHPVGKSVDRARLEVLEQLERDPGLPAHLEQLEPPGRAGLAEHPGEVGDGRGLGIAARATDGAVTVQDHHSPRSEPAVTGGLRTA